MANPCAECERPRLLPVNVEAANVYLACDTQWEYMTRGRYEVRKGLNYPALKTVMELHGVEDQTDVFQRVKIMEEAALQVIEEKLKQADDN